MIPKLIDDNRKQITGFLGWRAGGAGKGDCKGSQEHCLV